MTHQGVYGHSLGAREATGCNSAGQALPSDVYLSHSAGILGIKRLRFFLLFFIAVGWCGLSVAAYGATDAPWGEQVRRVELHTDAQLQLSQFAGMITQKAGQPLSAAKVSESLKRLFSTGHFRTLRADVQPEVGGVVLIFAGKARFFAGTVSIQETAKAIPADAVASAARIELGQPVTRAGLAAARQRILSLLAQNAYYQAQVKTSFRRDAVNQVADILFTVVPGIPAKLSAVRFEGPITVPSQRMAAVTGWKLGTHLTSAKIQHGLQRIHAFYAKRGNLEAIVGTAHRAFDPIHNTESVSVRVQPGRLVRVYVEGARISSGTLKKILPVYTEGLTDDLTLDSGAREIENYLERQGYFSARAQWRRITRPGDVAITYAVERGPQSVFESFDFRGNRHVSSDELAPLVKLQPASFPTRTHGLFSQNLVDQSVRTLSAYYQSRGFLSAKVLPVLHNNADELSVTFRVSEGPETRVGRLTMTGVDADTAAKLKKVMETLPGQPYSPALVTKDRDAILTWFADHGRDRAAASTRVSAGAHGTMDIIYAITPGPQEFVHNVVVIGNRHAHTGIIRRQLSFASGQPLSHAKLYDSQQHLYNLGLFSSVQIAEEDPGGHERQKNILVSVQEAKRWTLGYGFGLDVQRLTGNQPQGQLGASPRLSLNLTRINVGGRNQTFSLRGRVSDLETGADAGYHFLDFLNHPSLDLHFDATAYRTRDVLTFTSIAEQVSLALEKQFAPSTFLIGRYNYRYVRIPASTLRINPAEIPLISLPVRDAGFEVTFVHDTRDNPADATRGSYSLADANISADQLGSQADYTRFFGQNSTYYRLLGTRLIFARNTEFGVETPYGTSLHPPPGSSNGIPLALRFFAGGSDSLRAFSLNQAGPRDPVTGFPVGGNAMFVNQTELRFRLRQGKYGVVLFDDAGNVYSSLADMRLLKFTQNSPADLNYTVDAVGFGLRYRTPVGPIRLDLGYVLNPERFELTSPTTEVQTLPRFQYFFSIGQSF